MNKAKTIQKIHSLDKDLEVHSKLAIAYGKGGLGLLNRTRVF